MDSRLKLGIVIGALGVAGGLAWLSTARDARAQTTSTDSGATLALEGAGKLDGDYGTISAGSLGGNADGGYIQVTGKNATSGRTLNCTIKTKDQSTPLLAYQALRANGGKITCIGVPTVSTASKTVYNLETESYAIRPK